jgi:hypothetical protein
MQMRVLTRMRVLTNKQMRVQIQEKDAQAFAEGGVQI